MPTIGLGAKLEVNDGASSAFVEIPALLNLTVPDPEFGAAESKLLSQASDKTIRMVPTMKTPGEFQFQYEFDGDVKDRLDDLLGVSKQWKPTLVDGVSTWTKTVPGFLKSNKLDQVEPDQIQTVTAVVVVSGPDVA